MATGGMGRLRRPFLWAQPSSASLEAQRAEGLRVCYERFFARGLSGFLVLV
jgi:hypothetical protein